MTTGFSVMIDSAFTFRSHDARYPQAWSSLSYKVLINSSFLSIVSLRVSILAFCSVITFCCLADSFISKRSIPVSITLAYLSFSFRLPTCYPRFSIRLYISFNTFYMTFYFTTGSSPSSNDESEFLESRFDSILK